MKRKIEEAEEADVLDRTRREVQEGSGQLVLNIPREARRILDIDTETTVEITLYQTGYFVSVADGEQTDGDE